MKVTNRHLFLLLMILIATAWPASGRAERGWEYVGVRGGVNATGDGVVHEYEAFASYLFPWGLGEHGGWRLNTKGNGSLGFIRGGGNTGFIATVGPGVSIEFPVVPIELDGGISAAFLSEDVYDGKDLNGQVQFVSHIGVNLRIAGPFAVGYDFQHMSNADLNGGRNPGVNIHMFSILWYFGK